MDKDTALDLALEALRSAAAELYRASSYCNTYEVLGNTNDAITAIQKARAAQPAPDYAWPTVADYEKDVGFEVNEAFKMAWAMARTTNALFT